MARVVRNVEGQALKEGSIAEDAATNSIIITAARLGLDRIAYLVAQYDQPEPRFTLPADRTDRVHAIPLEHADPKLAAETINRLYAATATHDTAEAITAKAGRGGFC